MARPALQIVFLLPISYKWVDKIYEDFSSDKEEAGEVLCLMGDWYHTTLHQQEGNPR